MNLATSKQTREIFHAFQQRRDFFPHIRYDYIQRRIENMECIYQDGVIITFQAYKKSVRIGNVLIPTGAIMLHQILNTNQFNGNGGKIFEQFCGTFLRPRSDYIDLYLSVRKDNQVACKFYERHKMEVVGTVDWSNGTLHGLVYRRRIECLVN